MKVIVLSAFFTLCQGSEGIRSKFQKKMPAGRTVLSTIYHST